MIYTTLKEIYDNKNFLYTNDQLKYFNNIKNYIIKIYNKEIKPVEKSDIPNVVMWSGIYYYDYDKKKSFELWKSDFELTGNLYSCYYIGTCYLETNPKLALEYLCKDYSTLPFLQGTVYYQLGKYYDNDNNYYLALEYYTISAKMMNINSICLLIATYLHEDNYNTALIYIELGLLLDDAECMLAYSYYLMKYENNPEKSVLYLKKSIEKGNINAISALTSGINSLQYQQIISRP